MGRDAKFLLPEIYPGYNIFHHLSVGMQKENYFFFLFLFADSIPAVLVRFPIAVTRPEAIWAERIYLAYTSPS